jgi:hypothetical protein
MMEAIAFGIIALALALPALTSTVLSAFADRAARQSSKTKGKSEGPSKVGVSSNAKVIPVTFVQVEATSDSDATSVTVLPSAAAPSEQDRRPARRRAS